ncbi:MAG: hypothetical protein ACRDSZ_06910 [Pseudonocardiaceae bacterium]
MTTLPALPHRGAHAQSCPRLAPPPELCRNAGAVHEPDLWLWTVDDWVRFPWEPALPTGMAVENLVVAGPVQLQ